MLECGMSEPASKRRMAVLFLLLLGPLSGAVLLSYALHAWLGWDPYVEVCLEKRSHCGPSLGFWSLPIFLAIVMPGLALYQWLQDRRDRRAA
jgi:hypothetical protein